MPVFSYRTILDTSKGLFKEKGSKFMSFAFPVASEADIKEHLKKLRKEFFDARHHGYAYVLGGNFATLDHFFFVSGCQEQKGMNERTGHGN